MRLERHLQSIKYLSLIEQLAEDENTYVRMHVADHLGYYFNCDPEKCMSLGKKFCLDNKYVRYFLTPFLTFLAQYHRTECLELICIIVKTYGKEDLKAESEGLILETAVDIATQLWIMVGDNNYQSLFEELVSGTYNSSVKRKLITKYLLKVINLNEFLVRSYKVGIVIKVLEKIFDSNIDLSLKKEAKLILDKVDKRIYWKAENIAEKIKDL